MHRRANSQPTNTRPMYQSKDETWKANAEVPNNRWSRANESVASGRKEGGSAASDSPQKFRLNVSARGTIPRTTGCWRIARLSSRTKPPLRPAAKVPTHRRPRTSACVPGADKIGYLFEARAAGAACSSKPALYRAHAIAAQAAIDARGPVAHSEAASPRRSLRGEYHLSDKRGSGPISPIPAGLGDGQRGFFCTAMGLISRSPRPGCSS